MGVAELLLIAESLIAESAICTVLRVSGHRGSRTSHAAAHDTQYPDQLDRWPQPRDKIITDDAPAVPRSQERNSSSQKHSAFATAGKAIYRENKKQARDPLSRRSEPF